MWSAWSTTKCGQYTLNMHSFTSSIASVFLCFVFMVSLMSGELLLVHIKMQQPPDVHVIQKHVKILLNNNLLPPDKQSRGGWLGVITAHCSSSSSAPSPPVSLCKHDRTPTRYLKLETDGIGERYKCSTTRQVGKLESLMEQIGFCERLFGWHTQGPSLLI